MTYLDEDPWADVEALENERHEADHQQAEMTAVGNAIHRAEKAGICTHGSTVGYLRPAVYPEQNELAPGQSMCTKGTGGCRRIFESDADWYAAMDAAIGY
jgi:hypothetical protein